MENIALKRDSSIDLMRFIGFTCIVLAHIGVPAEMALFQLRTFDVPLMVFTSGLAFAGKSIDSYLPFVWKRTLRLIVPVYLFIGIYCLLNPLLAGLGWVDLYSPERIKGAFMLKLIPSIGYVWIIRVFLIVMLVTPLLIRLEKVLKNEWQFAAVFAAMGAAQHYLIKWLSPLHLGGFVDDWVLYLVGYSAVFLLGLHMRKADVKVRSVYFAVLALVMAAYAAVVYSEKGAWMVFQAFKYPPGVYYLLWGVVCSCFLWLTSRWWVPLLDNRLFTWIGRNTIWIYLWHIPFVNIVVGGPFDSWHWIFKYFFVYAAAVCIYGLQYNLVRAAGKRWPDSKAVRKCVLPFFCLMCVVSGCSRNQPNTPQQDRAIWVEYMLKVSDPVLRNTAEGTLKETMPYESNDPGRNTRRFSYLEAFGRTICGVAPWLESDEDDGGLKEEYRSLARRALANAVDPQSPDYMEFNEPAQPLVDAAYLAQGLLRAPVQLWKLSSDKVKQDIVTALRSTRNIKPYENNWLLFASMVEAAILEFTGECDVDRLTYGVEKFRDHWYKGDSFYGDGPSFSMDYYNSYVIHPMLMDVLTVMQRHKVSGWEFIETERERHTRFAEILERLVAPDGSYPVLGRSISACRCGSFQVLSQSALMGSLPATVTPGQVRCALTAVIVRQLENPDNFDGEGWLKIGFAGSQPEMAESYVNTGSLYHCTTAFLALGLPADDPFWTEPFTPWTGMKAWSGAKISGDHALHK